MTSRRSPLLLGLLLLGIVLMHGFAPQACAGGSSGMAGGSTAHHAQGSPSAGARVTPSAGARVAPSTMPRAYAGGDDTPGTVCVATPVQRSWDGLLALLTLLAIGLLLGPELLAGLRTPRAGPRTAAVRAPPIAGSTLLARLCVSRT